MLPPIFKCIQSSTSSVRLVLLGPSLMEIEFSCIFIIGIILVSVSVVADAFLPNFQERVFDQGSSRNEVISNR